MPYAEGLFGQLAVLLVLAALLGGVARLLRQPVIVALIALGVIAGPSALDIVTPENETFELLATMGISLLLFLVGLKLDVHVIRRTGPVALAAGLGQVLFTAVIGFGLAVALGMGTVEALYASVALTFSSTIIIVKLLTDKREIDSLHGHVAVGMLIVQDILVVLVMIGLSSIGAGAEQDDALQQALVVVAKGVAMIVVIALLMRYVLTPVFSLLAGTSELMVLAAIAWAVALAAISDELGFSTEIGAFLAGVSLASTPFREAVGSRLVSIRDFMLVFFFLVLGASLDLSLIGAQLVPALVLSIFVLVGNPAIVMVIMRAMGYRRRTGFLTGLAVAQISEFSFVFVALGLSLGHVGPDLVGLVTLVGLITIGVSTYLILYSHPIYQFLAPWLGVFENENPRREQLHEARPWEHFDVIVFGLDTFGAELAEELVRQGQRVLGVDFDPDVLVTLRGRVRVLYGDAEDPEFVASLPLHQVSWVVSTVPVVEINTILAEALRANGYDGRMALFARDSRESERIKIARPDLILSPQTDAAQRAAARILDTDAPQPGIRP